MSAEERLKELRAEKKELSDARRNLTGMEEVDDVVRILTRLAAIDKLLPSLEFLESREAGLATYRATNEKYRRSSGRMTQDERSRLATRRIHLREMLDGKRAIPLRDDQLRVIGSLGADSRKLSLEFAAENKKGVECELESINQKLSADGVEVV